MEISKTQQLIEEARSWKDTPWQHNQACKGYGVDCIRFTMSVYAKFGVNVGQLGNYSRKPRGNQLVDYLETLPSTTLKDVNSIKPGDLLVFRVARVPHHVGIATTKKTFIHADSGSNKVLEQELGRWEKRISAVFAVELGL